MSRDSRDDEDGSRRGVRPDEGEPALVATARSGIPSAQTNTTELLDEDVGELRVLSAESVGRTCIPW